LIASFLRKNDGGKPLQAQMQAVVLQRAVAAGTVFMRKLL